MFVLQDAEGHYVGDVDKYTPAQGYNYHPVSTASRFYTSEAALNWVLEYGRTYHAARRASFSLVEVREVPPTPAPPSIEIVRVL